MEVFFNVLSMHLLLCCPILCWKYKYWEWKMPFISGAQSFQSANASSSSLWVEGLLSLFYLWGDWVMLGLCLNKKSSHSSLEGSVASLTWAPFAPVCNRMTEASLTHGFWVQPRFWVPAPVPECCSLRAGLWFRFNWIKIVKGKLLYMPLNSSIPCFLCNISIICLYICIHIYTHTRG